MGQRGDLIKEKCISCAYQIIEDEGIKYLTIRNILTKTNLRNGSLYKQFKNLNEIIHGVNSITLKKLKKLLQDAITKGAKNNASEKETLLEISTSFIKFATQNQNLWVLLFDYKNIDYANLPDWASKEIEESFLILVDYFSKTNTNKEQAKAFAAILWSSLHGLISLHINNKLQTITPKTPKQLAQTLIEKLWT